MADSPSENGAGRKRRGLLAESGIRLVREKPLGTVGAAITLVFLLIAVFADALAPYGMNYGTGSNLAPPSAEFWLGTDELGRDLLSRIIIGARVSLGMGLAASAMSIVMSVVIGIMSGYIGGRFDLIVQRVVDAWMSLPALIWMMLILSIIGRGVLEIVIVLSLVLGVGGSRIIRGAVISAKEEVYVAAASAIGAPTYKVLIRHILPGVMAPIIMLFSVRVPDAIMIEAALSFLGFGIAPPFPSWGRMLAGNARLYMFVAPWMALWPGLALALVVYGVNIFGDALRDILDPRMRGGAGRYEGRAKRAPSANKAFTTNRRSR